MLYLFWAWCLVLKLKYFCMLELLKDTALEIRKLPPGVRKSFVIELEENRKKAAEESAEEAKEGPRI